MDTNKHELLLRNEVFQMWAVQWSKENIKNHEWTLINTNYLMKNIRVYSCLFVVKRKHEEPRMDTNGHELLLRNEVFQIVGCAMCQKKI